MLHQPLEHRRSQGALLALQILTVSINFLQSKQHVFLIAYPY